MTRVNEPFFISYSNKSRGQRLGYQGIYYMVKAIAQEAGINDVHPHRGRHTFASQLIEEGMDAYLAMTLMRQKTARAFHTYSHRVRYQAAKAAFWDQQGITQRKVRSLEEMLRGE